MANALKEIEHAQRLCDRGDITIGEYFDLVEKWEDAEPIKHGRWIEDFVEYECSVCGGRISDSTLADNSKPNYCPNCGASMDEVEE